MMIDPTHIVVDQNLTENFKLKIYPGQGKMIEAPISLTIVTDQNLTEILN